MLLSALTLLSPKLLTYYKPNLLGLTCVLIRNTIVLRMGDEKHDISWQETI
jgi:hypothetical protein